MVIKLTYLRGSRKNSVNLLILPFTYREEYVFIILLHGRRKNVKFRFVKVYLSIYCRDLAF